MLSLSLAPHNSHISQTEYATTAISILKDFGRVELAEELEKKNSVHSPKNMLMLEPVSRSHFDNLNVWFESHPRIVTHNISCATPTELVHSPTATMFKSLGHIVRAISHVTLKETELVVHLSRSCATMKNCFLILNFSISMRCVPGSRTCRVAAGAFNKLEWDIEDTIVLASDGSSAPLLDHALRLAAVA